MGFKWKGVTYLENDRCRINNSGIHVKMRNATKKYRDMKCYVITVPAKLFHDCRQQDGMSAKELLEQINNVVSAIPDVLHSAVVKDGVQVCWPRPKDDETARSVNQALIEMGQKWGRGRGALPLKKQLLIALEDPTYKLHACVYDASVRGHDDTLHTVYLMEDWW